MRIQPIGKGFKLTCFVYPNGLSPTELGERVHQTAHRLLFRAGADADPEETSRRELIRQSGWSPLGRSVREGAVSEVDERRDFTPWQKQQLFLLSGGRCCSCGSALRASWHADHVLPHARGGRTEVNNGRALCPDCNLSKGAKVLTVDEG